MAELFTNMARSRLASAIADSDLSLTVLTGDGNDLFPVLGVGDYCRCVLLNLTTGNTEIIKVTARTGDVLTIERAAEEIGNITPAVAYAFNANDIIELRPTAAYFDSLTVTDAEIQAGDYLYCVDSSAAANDIAIAASPTVTVLAAGMGFRVKVAVANTGASTLTVDGTAATAIKKHHDQALASGDLEAGGVYDFVYDGTVFQLLTPVAIRPNVTIQKFTVSGAWTKPAGCRKVIIEMVGGGGGGGGVTSPSDDEYTLGGGGGAGGYTKAEIDVTTIASATITIGAAGSGGGAGGSGGTGGVTSWADGTNTVEANGGVGGTALGSTANTFSRTVAGGAGGAATTVGGNRIEIAGGYGGRAMAFAGTATTFTAASGPGADSVFGGSPISVAVTTTAATNGIAGLAPGAGGSGAVAYRHSGGAAPGTATGGAGVKGIVIVTEFYY